MVKRYNLSFYEGVSLEDNGSFVHCDDYEALKSELDALREQVRWRDVREELPEEHQTVIVFCKYDKEPTAAYINQGYWYEKHEHSIISGDAWVDHTICKVGSDEYDAVTHWNPMPTPPTSQTNKD